MTVYSKRALAFPNPGATDPKGGDGEIRLGYEQFNYNVPDGLREHPYFKANEAEGNLIVMETPKDVEKVTTGAPGKRANSDKEAKPEDLGIADGGEAKK